MVCLPLSYWVPSLALTLRNLKAILNNWFFEANILWLLAEVRFAKLPLDECHYTLLMIRQHWHKLWLGAVIIDTYVCRHMASSYHIELRQFCSCRTPVSGLREYGLSWQVIDTKKQSYTQIRTLFLDVACVQEPPSAPIQLDLSCGISSLIPTKATLLMLKMWPGIYCHQCNVFNEVQSPEHASKPVKQFDTGSICSILNYWSHTFTVYKIMIKLCTE